MTRDRIVPCLWFDDQAEEAAAFYVATFPDASTGEVARYPSSGPNPSRKPPGSVMTVDFAVAGQRFVALNGGPAFSPNPSISFFVYVPIAQEVDRLHHALLAGGMSLMPLDAYPWSDRYGWVMDRFGVSWQVMAAPGVERATVAPCLMFTGANHGRAREAIDAYVAAFPEARIAALEQYTGDDGPAGTVKHGRFTIGDQQVVVMDSHGDHPFTFSEAISLQVMCADQDEVDHYWRALAEGGEAGRCGWLKDRFGVSWQVVPEAIVEWLAQPDAAVRDRAFQAMLGMDKLDIAELRRASAGA
jgi:predicted 3-demethylubiquinone-9 3-methyltransferase (glyoxalase superfamily)